ncbi:MAG TPA: hypothetical protein VIX81_05500 [Gammaproteobacteria bacterium]
MIVELVTFSIPPGMSREQVLEAARSTYAGWQADPALVRKHYLLDAERGVAGGCYVWRSRAAAEAAHGAAFRQRVRARFGSEPEFAYFDLQVLLDNETGAVTEF